MGLPDKVRNLFAPTSEKLRADLAKAEAEHKAATDAWSEDETPARWKIAEDLERVVKQLALRLARAEQTEAKARDEAAEKKLSARRAEITAAVERIRKTPTFVAETVAAVADLGAELAKHQKAILAHEDACSRDRRFIEDESRRLGVDPPRVDTTAPTSAVGIGRLCGLAVRQRNIKDGVSRDIEQNAVELVRGSS